jgi:hypothetical protein
MKRALFSFAFLLVIGTLVCQAQQDPRIDMYVKAKENKTLSQIPRLDELFPEWRLSRVVLLCMLVSNRVLDSDRTRGYKYLYTSKIYEAARVDTANDNEEVIAKKIRAMWAVADQLELFQCSGAQFDVTKGNMLKWAVSYQFDAFVKDILKWKIPLNKVDASDNRTLLDYIQFWVERNKGNAMEPVYQDFYDRFRAAGAKHRAEL